MDPYQTTRHLPADLLSEILSRLPVKSLLRFRCVAKLWLSLVDDDADFAQLHLHNFKNNSDKTRLFVVQTKVDQLFQECILRCSDTFELKSKIPISFSNHDWDVVSTLHGLILLKSPPNKSGQFGELKLWNPSIRKFLQIPTYFKPRVSRHSSSKDRDIGLGYDQVANKYKHVKLVFVDNVLHSLAIYALGANSWKIIEFQKKGSGSPCCYWHWVWDGVCEAVYFQSSMYFFARDICKDRGWALVWFDLSKEVFSSSSMPVNLYSKLVSIDNGGSSVVAIDTYSSEIYAWALDSESMCWTKTHLYSLKKYYFFHTKRNGDMLLWKPYCANRYGGLVFRNKVISCNLETKERKTLQLCDFHIYHSSCYVESLIMHK